MNNYDTYCYQFDTQPNPAMNISPPQTDQVSWADCDAVIKQEAQHNEMYHMTNGSDDVDNFFDGLDNKQDLLGSNTYFSPDDQSNSNDSNNASMQSPGNFAPETNVADRQTEVERKKALNRAAQRAFRRRREQKVQELEDQLAVAQQTVENTTAQNERMFHENTALVTENKLLKEERLQLGSSRRSTPEETSMGKVTFPENTFPGDILHSNKYKPRETSPFTMTPESNASDQSALLNRAAIWAKIVENPDIPDDIDFDRIVELLKGKAVCEEKGPVFLSEDVERAIEEACKYLH